MEKVLYEYEVVSKNIVFVDGLTRTGKALLNNLLLGFDKVSSIQFINILEQLMPLYINGEMTKNAISSFLRLYFNENFYNYKLSRNMNFRYDDLTSIHRVKNPQYFYENLGKADGDIIIDELKNDELCFQFQTHDLLTHYSKFLELNIDAKILELFRHPVDTIHSWYERGWGTRFDEKDPRSGTTLFLHKDRVVPHYVVGNEEEYIKLNEMEKCIFMHNLLLRKSIFEYKKLEQYQKKKILIIKYDDLLENTDAELKKIEFFLNVKKSSHMETSKEEAKVPRGISIKTRESKLNEILSKANSSISKDLLSLIESYEIDFYKLKN